MENTQEQWKDIKGFEGYYQVSNEGRVKSVERNVNGVSKLGKPFIRHQDEKILNQGAASDGYLLVVLSKDRKRETCRVHRLVAEAFVPNPNNYEVAHHKDHNPTNNNAENLEWMDEEEHRRHHGREFKMVYQYDQELNLITIYPTTAEAARQLNLSQGNISLCCQGVLKDYKGFYFSFQPLQTKDDIETLHQQGEDKRNKRDNQVNQAQIKYRQNNKDKLREIALSYYYNHREEMLTYQKERYHRLKNERIQNTSGTTN